MGIIQSSLARACNGRIRSARALDGTARAFAFPAGAIESTVVVRIDIDRMTGSQSVRSAEERVPEGTARRLSAGSLGDASLHTVRRATMPCGAALPGERGSLAHCVEREAAMQFFFYCRDRAGAAEMRRALLPDHWAFMRQYKDVLIARGPTMSADGATMTGSMHMVELPDANAAQVFAYEEPLAKAGVFEDILESFKNLNALGSYT
jgi:uncharacterized protein YciI